MRSFITANGTPAGTEYGLITRNIVYLTVRMFGGAQDAMLLCAGGAEVWFEPVLKPWDLAAISLIAKESGARYFDFAGQDSIYSGNGVICVPGLEEAVRELLGLA